MKAIDLLAVIADYQQPVTAEHLSYRLRGVATSVHNPLWHLRTRGDIRLVRRPWRFDAYLITDQGRKRLENRQ